MFKSVRFQNFKGLRDYSVTLKKMNVLVGPNNAGKSTILDGFRALSAAIRFANRRNPTALYSKSGLVTGWEVPWASIPICSKNIHSDYRDDSETSITFTCLNGGRLQLSFYEGTRVILTVDHEHASVRTISQFKRCFPVSINNIPTLGPLEEEEQLLSDDYVDRWRGSRLSHRMFRNIWYRQATDFEVFKSQVEQTWPGMSIKPPERHGYAPVMLSMFCAENRIEREICWAGFGFQVWVQILTHLIGASNATTLIVDEPEIYLHPDLQHKLFGLLRSAGAQILLATHSVEIINEAEHDDVVLVNKSRRSGKRISDIDGLQTALFSIGSAQNIHLSKLSRGKKILFLEGQDYKLIKRFAGRLGLDSLGDDINLTVIPLGGFTQKQKIEDASWVFQKVLRAEISIAALLDRDYRCDEEIDQLVSSMRSSVPCFHILGAKEIENYLLVPEAIHRAIQERLREQGEGSSIHVEDTEALLDACAEEVKADVSAQLIAHRTRFFSGRDARDTATVVAETIRQLDCNWLERPRRLFLVPGKQILTSLNRKLDNKYRISITAPQIVKHLPVGQLDKHFQEILIQLNKFASD